MSSHPLKIAQFITQYPYPEQFDGGADYYCAGAGRVAQQISEAFARKGHEVHVFTAADGPRYEETEQNGVIVHRSPSITRINTTEIPPTILLDHIKTGDFDVIHAHNSTPPGMLAAYVKSRFEDTPLVITHHGGEQYESHGGLVRRGGLYLYTRVLMHELFGYATQVTIPSEGYIEESQVLTNPDVDVTRLRNGVSVDKFDLDLTQEEAKTELGLDPNEFVILYMGALHQRKGPDVLVKAFDQIDDDVGDSTLIMAGSGGLADSLRADAGRLGVDDAVSFPGFVPEAEKPTYLAAADVFVLPSTTGGAEMFPLAILEAAAAGTPVITSDFPTLRPIIEEYDIGRLVQPGDADDLTKAITDICDEETLTEYSANALRMARDHSWNEIVDEYLSLYEDVIAEDGTTGPQQPL